MINDVSVGMLDKHLNAFYSYRTNHLEDNVTRALIITLSQLSPVHVRSLLRDVVFNEKPSMRDRVDLMAEPDFAYDLQIGTWEEELLTSNNGAIVGITWSGAAELGPAIASGDAGKGRPDALLSDRANDLTVIFESKLRDDLYADQLKRHLNTCFDPTVTQLAEVLVEISWSDIAEYLNKIAKVAVASHEKWMINEFLEYLERLQLLDFLGFRSSDIVNVNEPKLHRFLGRGVVDCQSDLQLKDYSRNNMIFFDDAVGVDNIYVTLSPEGLEWGIVCGSGKKWRAEELKHRLTHDPDSVGKMIEDYRQAFKELDPEIETRLAIHTYFRLSRFRTEWLPNVEGRTYAYPNEFGDFCRCFTSDKFNAMRELNKNDINRDFAELIEREHPQVDSKGLFPRWEDKDEFLQYAYCHVYAVVPGQLLGSTADQAMQLFRKLAESSKKLVAGLWELR